MRTASLNVLKEMIPSSLEAYKSKLTSPVAFLSTHICQALLNNSVKLLRKIRWKTPIHQYFFFVFSSPPTPYFFFSYTPSCHLSSRERAGFNFQRKSLLVLMAYCSGEIIPFVYLIVKSKTLRSEVATVT